MCLSSVEHPLTVPQLESSQIKKGLLRFMPQEDASFLPTKYYEPIVHWLSFSNHFEKMTFLATREIVVCRASEEHDNNIVWKGTLWLWRTKCNNAFFCESQGWKWTNASCSCCCCSQWWYLDQWGGGYVGARAFPCSFTSMACSLPWNVLPPTFLVVSRRIREERFLIWVVIFVPFVD